MKNESRKVGELTCLELFHLTARQLWGTYDSGGINAGRSYQATLLEGFIGLFSLELREIEGDALGEVLYRFKTAYKSIASGDRLQTEQPFLPFKNLCILDDFEFTFLCLREMNRWYEQEAERAGFFNTLHKNLARGMFLAFRMHLKNTPLDAVKSIQFDKESLKQYCIRRSSFRTHGERLREFEEQGINPWNDIYS